MEFNEHINKLEKGWKKKRKKRKERKPRDRMPRRPNKGQRYNISIMPELAEWLESTTGLGWNKCDIFNAGLAMVHMIETQGELPESIEVNDFPYRPWENDSLSTPKKQVLRKRREQYKMETSKYKLKNEKPAKVSKPKPKKLADQIELEADAFNWDDA